jgi:cytochrome c553
MKRCASRRSRASLAVAVLFLAGAFVAPARAQTLTERLSVCLSCHGESGRSETAEVPSLGKQPAEYLLIQLYQFREKARIAPPMNDMAQDLTDEDLREFSETLAKLPPPTPIALVQDAALTDRARDLVVKYQCAFCHNSDFSGHDQIPRIAAQREDYLVKSLRQYKSGERPGYDPAMNEAAQRLTEPEIADLARYLANWR